MPSFESGDIIKVPFPYAEKPVRRFRPALVVSGPVLEDLHGLLWVLMITSARNKPWAGDVEITRLKEAGLPAASVVRCAKIAAIDAGSAKKIGALDSAHFNLVRNMMHRALDPEGSRPSVPSGPGPR